MENRILPKDIIRIVVSVLLILLIPLIGTLYVPGWSWGVTDFIFMGALLFFTGLGITFAAKKITSPAHRVAAIAGVIVVFLAIWTELAVGAVSQLVHFLFV